MPAALTTDRADAAPNPGASAGRGFRLGFDTLDQEVSIDRLPIDGLIPDWLGGQLLRTGPARFEVGDQAYRHWFDGLAMLHAFTFGGGAVGYRNRFLRGRAYQGATETGRITLSEFGTDPCRSIFRRFATVFDPGFTDNGNVNITRIAGRYLALTETPLPVEFDPKTLETAGVYDHDGDGIELHHTTAHPHHDPETNQAFNYFAHFGASSSYNVYSVGGGSGARTVFGRRKVREPAYIHSFGLTPRFLVLVEFPYVVNPLALLMSGKPFIENFRWRPERPARFLVFRRSDGELAAEAETSAFFAFHHVNAYEERDDVVVDICAYDDPSVVRSLYLDVLRSPDFRGVEPQLRRYRVSLPDGSVDRSVLAEAAGELPRINYSRNGRDYRYAYFAGADPARPENFIERLVKVDVKTGGASTWREDGCHPGEVVFVAAPGARAEDDGVLLSVVLDAPRERSFLLVLDAAAFEEIGRATVPHHVPFGFHGQYFR